MGVGPENLKVMRQNVEKIQGEVELIENLGSIKYITISTYCGDLIAAVDTVITTISTAAVMAIAYLLEQKRGYSA